MQKFDVQMSKWCTKSTKEIHDLLSGVILELFSAIIKDTPVLNGYLRGNWLVSSMAPRFGVLDVMDPGGNKATYNIGKLVSSLPLGKDVEVYMTNSLPYAYKIEYLGHSKIKAPGGMVVKNFTRITQLLKARTS